MNESIAMVKANVTLLEKENQKYRNDVMELTSKVKAAIQANRDDIATTYATQLQTVKSALNRNEQQLMGARLAFDKAMQVKQAFMREKDRKTNDAMQALRDARRRSGRARSPTPWRASRLQASTPRTMRCCRRSRRGPRSTKRAWKWPCRTSTRRDEDRGRGGEDPRHRALEAVQTGDGMEAPSSAPEGQKTLEAARREVVGRKWPTATSRKPFS